METCYLNLTSTKSTNYYARQVLKPETTKRKERNETSETRENHRNEQNETAETAEMAETSERKRNH